MPIRSVDAGILSLGPNGPRLLGSRCTVCGTYSFPVQDGCPRCTATAMEAVELAPRGTLWTWTIQGFPPKAPPFVGDTDPERFAAFGVGYVELPGQVRVEAQAHRERSRPTRDRDGHVPRARAPHDGPGRHRGRDVRVRAAPTEYPDDWRRHRRHRHARVRPHRRRVRARPGCGRGAAGPRRRRGRVGGHAVRGRGLGRRRSGRHVGVEARPHRAAVHQRRQRLRHRRHRAVHRRQRDHGRHLRHRHRDRLRQARARRVPRGHAGGRVGGLVRRERPCAHDPVLRHEDQPLHARARHHAARRSRRWPPRPSATER